MGFKEKILELRKKNGLSQKNLADALGVAQSSINYWEKGQRAPSANIVIKIAEFFGVSVDYLCSDYEGSAEDFYSDIPKRGFVRIGSGEHALEVDPIDFIEHFNKVAKIAHPSDMSNMIDDFFKLNTAGKKEAARQVKLLTKIPEFLNKSEKDTDEGEGE